jgi:hypothetical protein
VHDFVFAAHLPRVVFGAGALQRLPDELAALGLGRALILSTPGQRALAERVAALLGDRAVGVFAGAAMHVPVASARAACEEARRLGADSAVAIGGGSTTGLGKAIALETSLPVIAVPTTYAGSEMTTVYGLTDAGHEDDRPRRSRAAANGRLRPRAVGGAAASRSRSRACSTPSPTPPRGSTRPTAIRSSRRWPRRASASPPMRCRACSAIRATSRRAATRWSRPGSAAR